MMDDLSQNMYGYQNDTIVKDVDMIQDQVNISKKAKRKLLQQKLYYWLKIPSVF